MQNALLSGIDLSNKNFYQASLSGANFTGTGFTDGRLLKANFRNADLSKAKLNNIDLSDLNFTNCDLSDAVLTGSRAIGTNFTGANLQGAFLNTAVNFIRTKFISADMRNLMAFKSCTDVNFSYADMSGKDSANKQVFKTYSFSKAIGGPGCKFNFTNLTNTDFTGVSFTGADFSGSSMIGSIFITAKFVSNCIFGDSAGNNANLSDSDFNSADFYTSGGAIRLSNTIRSTNTNFIVATWWNGVNCGGSASYNGVCADSSGNVQP